MTDLADSSEVGYGKPPKPTRFAKGQSGNPKGRPRGAKNLETMFLEACRERVTVTRNGRKVRMTKFSASVHQLVNRAAGGELKAIRELLYWSRLFTGAEAPSQSAVRIEENDRIVMESVLRRLRRSQLAEGSREHVEPKRVEGKERPE